MKINRRFLLSSLSFLILFSLLVTSQHFVHADSPFASGSGTGADPYVIATCAQLQAIAYPYSDSNFVQTADVDCAGFTFVPITSFTGTFDGRGHNIKGLTINRPSSEYVGLFAQVDSAAVLYDIHLTLGDGSEGGVTGGTVATGSLVGILYNSSRVIGCSSTLSVTSAGARVGGLVGQSYFGQVYTSHAEGIITSTGNNAVAGGLLGQAYYFGTFQNNHATAGVTASGTNSTAGGLIGETLTSGGYTITVSQSYADGSASATLNAGGLIGYSHGDGPNTTNQNYSGTLVEAGATNRGAILGKTANSNTTVSNTRFDQTNTTLSACTGTGTLAGTPTCTAVNTDGNDGGYLVNNNTNVPFNSWDFTTKWQTAEGLPPQLRAATTGAAPDAPTSFAVSESSSRQTVVLTWVAPASMGTFSLSSYYIYYKRADQSWGDANSTYTSDITTSIGSLNYDTTYNFRIVARTAYGDGASADVTYAIPAQIEHDISTCAQLQAMGDDSVAYQGNDLWLITADLNCTPGQDPQWDADDGLFNPLFPGTYFTGTFNGQNHTITGLTISKPSDSGVALFSYGGTATIKNLKLVGGSVTGGANVGSLIGYSSVTTVDKVTSSIDVTGSQNNIGGLVGFAGGITMTSSSVTGDVTGTESATGYIGGLIGNTSGGTLTDTFASSTITSPVGATYVGGINGYSMSTTITNSYAAGSVTGGDFVGGFMGASAWCNITNNFSTSRVTALASNSPTYVGGFFGQTTSAGTNNFFDAYRASQEFCGYILEGGPYLQENSSTHCDPVNVDNAAPNYFTKNHLNPPLNSWAFTGTPAWVVHASSLPGLAAFDSAEYSSPTAVQNLSATPGGIYTTLSWDAPTSNGGDPLTDYAIQYKLSSEPSTWTTWSHVATTSTGATITGLTAETSYDFSVEALNEPMGYGVTSTVSNITTSALSTPGAPESLAAASGQDSLSLSWNAPTSDGGDLITDYTITYKITGSEDSPTTLVHSPTTMRTAVITGLSVNTSYTITVAAVTGQGTGSSATLTKSTLANRTLTSFGIPEKIIELIVPTKPALPIPKPTKVIDDVEAQPVIKQEASIEKQPAAEQKTEVPPKIELLIKKLLPKNISEPAPQQTLPARISVPKAVVKPVQQNKPVIAAKPIVITPTPVAPPPAIKIQPVVQPPTPAAPVIPIAPPTPEPPAVVVEKLPVIVTAPSPAQVRVTPPVAVPKKPTTTVSERVAESLSTVYHTVVVSPINFVASSLSNTFKKIFAW